MKPVENQDMEHKPSFMHGLLEPSVPVSTREQRSKIVFQTKVLFTVIMLIPIFMLLMVMNNKPSDLLTNIDFILAVITLIGFSTFFYLTKRGYEDHVSIAVPIFVSIMILVLAVLTFSDLSPYPKESVDVIIFMLLPIILSVTLLDLKKSAIVISGDLMIVLVLPVFFPWINLYDIIMGPFILLFTISVFLLFFSKHRGDLEDDRKRDLKDREEKLRSMIASSPEGLILSDIDANIINCNRAVVEMMAYDSKEDMIGKNIFEFIPTKEIERAGKNYNQTLREGTIRDVEYTLKRKDGSTFRCLLSFSVIKGPEGESKALIATIKDITKRKETERWENLLDTIIRTDIQRGNQLINGYLDLLLDTDLNDYQKDIVARALSASRSQNELIHKIELLRNLGKERARGKVDPVFLLKDSIKVYKTEMLKNNIQFFDEIEEVTSKVASEGRGGVLIESVFTNLLDRIVKDSDVDRLKVQTEETRDHVKVSFIYDGEREEEVKDIIDGFVEDPGITESELNVYLVKNIVETFGGKVEYKDYEKGGSRFDIWLRKVYDNY